jgi:hypothetical protein
LETQVRTPQIVFTQPQKLVVPMFQRPYVWNEESQWEPLWIDVVRMADRLLQEPGGKQHPHFLGAVVLQQVQKQTGQMQERMIIDGQQRLTTLQLFLDAMRGELVRASVQFSALRIKSLVVNDEAFCSTPGDRLKVLPTNRDRAVYQAVMGKDPNADYDTLGHRGERLLEAHKFFSGQVRVWLAGKGADQVQARAEALETVMRDLLQMVVIDLTADENAQEIFETLNARGAQLSSADLIKNFIFQRLLEKKANVQAAYDAHWKDFETGFWEAQIGVGRLLYPRSAIFLNHWLIARTGKEVLAREVFTRFKRYADQEAGVPMVELLNQVHAASRVYRGFIEAASTLSGPIDASGLFGYRTGVLESEVIKPLVLYLRDPREAPVPEEQFKKAQRVLESWMVRRMLVRATTKNYNQVIAELIGVLRESGRSTAGDTIETYFRGQSSDSKYWPDNDELRKELGSLQAYRRLGRGRLRMVLEAIEDHQRGWRQDKAGLGEERAPRGRYAIEHVMPRRWSAHWPLTPGVEEAEREELIHTLGNLTLLTGKLNSKVSNASWVGTGGKRAGLEGHDVLFLNRELLRSAKDAWTEDTIRKRTQALIEIITEIWPVPKEHRSGVIRDKQPRLRKKVRLSDLIGAGALTPGMSLFPRRKKHVARVATLLQDGQVEVDGVAYSSASEAASKIVGHPINGWAFFLVDQSSKKSLRGVRREYVSAMAVEADDDDSEDGEDS